MEFLIYNSVGKMVCSIIAYGIEQIDWDKFADMFVTGGYFVVDYVEAVCGKS